MIFCVFKHKVKGTSPHIFNIAHQQTNFIIIEIEDHLAPFILCVNNTLHDGQYIGVTC